MPVMNHAYFGSLSRMYKCIWGQNTSTFRSIAFRLQYILWNNDYIQPLETSWNGEKWTQWSLNLDMKTKYVTVKLMNTFDGIQPQGRG